MKCLWASVIVTPWGILLRCGGKDEPWRALSEVFGLKSYPQCSCHYAKPNIAIGSRVRAYRLYRYDYHKVTPYACGFRCLSLLKCRGEEWVWRCSSRLALITRLTKFFGFCVNFQTFKYSSSAYRKHSVATVHPKYVVSFTCVIGTACLVYFADSNDWTNWRITSLCKPDSFAKDAMCVGQSKEL
jgi:hypothetical protein